MLGPASILAGGISAPQGKRASLKAPQSSQSPFSRPEPWVACAAGGALAVHSRRRRVRSHASVKLFSPAKVNLFLRIVGKRPDGFHDLASLFHAVAFGDTLEMEPLEGASQDELECNMPNVPTDESNLVIRALNLFRARSGYDGFFHLNLQKTIPAQAGMGGGSSNAATALYGANVLAGQPSNDLMGWAEDPVVGSDATFFLSEGTAYCTGRGELVRPVAPLACDLPVYLIKPKVGLPTPSIFKALDAAQTDKRDPEKVLATFEGKVEDWAWVNDLEAPAFKICPELGELKAFLQSDRFGFQAVQMSGSGSTIFCVGEPRVEPTLELLSSFDIEGVWRTSLLRRSGQDWYSAA